MPTLQTLPELQIKLLVNYIDPASVHACCSATFSDALSVMQHSAGLLQTSEALERPEQSNGQLQIAIC